MPFKHTGRVRLPDTQLEVGSIPADGTCGSVGHGPNHRTSRTSNNRRSHLDRQALTQHLSTCELAVTARDPQGG
jgi:hypothetical protein